METSFLVEKVHFLPCWRQNARVILPTTLDSYAVSENWHETHRSLVVRCEESLLEHLRLNSPEQFARRFSLPAEQTRLLPISLPDLDGWSDLLPDLAGWERGPMVNAIFSDISMSAQSR